MEVVEATGRILEAGKSPELTALLASVAEATSADGEARYGAKTYLDLTRAIVCRTYAKPVLQLCHLINAADACGAGPDRWERFFYGVDTARASAFRGYLTETLSQSGWRRPGFEATGDGVEIQYEDGEFNIRYGRMPLLAALLETVLTMVGYVEINDIFAAMTARAGEQAAVHDAANALNRAIYAYLKSNLPSSQSADKFGAILDYLKATGDGQVGGSAVDIDDETVLRFWCGHDTESGDGDFRAFKTAVGAFIDFLRALETGGGRHAVTYAAAIGNDAEQGEVDPGDIDDDEILHGAWVNPLAALDEPPVDAIKFLNKKERENVDTLMDCGPLVENLPLTVLRSDTFGAQQARITQAARRKSDAKGLVALIDCADVEPYVDCSARYDDADRHLENIQMAALHALTSDGGGERSGIDMANTDRGDNVVPLFADTAPASNLSATVRDDAARAYRNISRKGFAEADLYDPDIRDGFRVGAGALVRIREHLGRYLATLDRLQSDDPDFNDQFTADRKTFRDRFSVLYGGPS